MFYYGFCAAVLLLLLLLLLIYCRQNYHAYLHRYQHHHHQYAIIIIKYAERCVVAFSQTRKFRLCHNMALTTSTLHDRQVYIQAQTNRPVCFNHTPSTYCYSRTRKNQCSSGDYTPYYYRSSYQLSPFT